MKQLKNAIARGRRTVVANPMKPDPETPVFTSCACNTHAISVSAWVEDGEVETVEVDFWQLGIGAQGSWRRWLDRVVAAWGVLRYGNLHQHGVVLTPEDARTFSSALLEKAGEKEREETS
jgi:hypothetical protein